jgi:translation initiation factor IF-2
MDEEIEKAESRTTQGVGVTIGILVAEGLVALLKTDMAKEAGGKIKRVIKKVLTKAKKKTTDKPKLTLNYEDLSLVFTSTDDKKIDDSINELVDYIHA